MGRWKTRGTLPPKSVYRPFLANFGTVEILVVAKQRRESKAPFWPDAPLDLIAVQLLYRMLNCGADNGSDFYKRSHLYDTYSRTYNPKTFFGVN